MRSTKHPMVLGMNFYRSNMKLVAGLTATDTAKHLYDISAYVPKNTVAILLMAVRTAGTGNLRVFPDEGVIDIYIDSAAVGTQIAQLIGIKNQRFQYALTVANDTFDVYMFGYFVERVVGE